MRSMSFSDLAYEVISKFVGPEDVPTAVLKDIVNRSFKTFRHPSNFIVSTFCTIFVKKICIVCRCDACEEVERVLGA
jgi:hypothetical protein